VHLVLGPRVESRLLMRLVLGVGSPLCGDDGVSIQVLELLKQHELPEDVVLLDAGTPGFEMVCQLQEWAQVGGGQVTIVDAVNMGEMPGVWRRFTPEEVRLIASGEHLSLHQVDLADSLALADALGVLPEKIVIYGIEPACTDWKMELSPEVSAVVPELVKDILGELEEIRL
jgi:hydrogenase maturation protease